MTSQVDQKDAAARAIGLRISDAMASSGIDKFELAGKVKCTAREIDDYGFGRVPSLFRLIAIADALDVSLDWLTGRTTSK